MSASAADLFTTKADKSRARLQRFWAAARDYWRPSRTRLAWPLTASLGAVVLASLAITYGLNLWNRHFFDALQAKDTAAALHQGSMFPLWVGAYLAMCVFAMWARMAMQRTWRAFLNDDLLDRWLTRARFYQLELIDGDHKNPEHRINDDVRVATEMPVDFVTGFHVGAFGCHVLRRLMDRGRRDAADRAALRAHHAGEKPSRGRIPLFARSGARKRGMHRAAARRAGRACDRRPQLRNAACALDRPRRPADAHGHRLARDMPNSSASSRSCCAHRDSSTAA